LAATAAPAIPAPAVAVSPYNEVQPLRLATLAAVNATAANQRIVLCISLSLFSCLSLLAPASPCLSRKQALARAVRTGIAPALFAGLTAHCARILKDWAEE
jgi:hypothetical protein